MKFLDYINAPSDIPCFVCAGKTELCMNVKMGEVEKNKEGNISIPVTINTAVLSCTSCEWETDLKESI